MTQEALQNQAADEGEGLSLTVTPEQKMRAIKTLTEIFGVGTQHADPGLLRILTKGLLIVDRISPDGSVYNLGGNVNFGALARQGITFPHASSIPGLVSATILVNGQTIKVTPDQIAILAPTITLGTPAAEQTNALGVIASTPTAQAFYPANAMVRVGVVQLNKISKYLSDLPNDAKGQFIISPKTTAGIFDRDLGTWNEDTASIRNIDESHGIHFEGHALTGMQIFDYPENIPGVADAPDVSYEKAWANEISAAYKKASSTGQNVTTGLAIGTKELIHGRKPGSRDVTVPNNLYSRLNDVNAQIAKQGGEEIITEPGSGDARWQHTATENPGGRANAYSVLLSDGASPYGRKDYDLSSSSPVAFCVLAPDLAR